MPKLEITPRERSELRAAAHPLRPVVLIGDAGLTDAVLKEIELNLNAHGLIKVRAGGQAREDREAMLATICDTLSCAAVHHLGKVLILYRPGGTKPLATEPDDAQAPKRRASDPHTPKKLAASGKVLTRQDVRAARRDAVEQDKRETDSPRARYLELNKAGRPVRPATRKPAAKTPAARRAGSAMSLKAGIRRGLTGGLVRKRATTVKK